MFTIPTPIILITITQTIDILTVPLVIFIARFISLSIAPSVSMSTLSVAALEWVRPEKSAHDSC